MVGVAVAVVVVVRRRSNKFGAVPTEHDEQASFFREARLRGATDSRWLQGFAIPNGGLRNKVTAVKLKREGVRAGVPDIFFPVPSGEFCGLFVEMKRTKGGKVSDEQKAFAAVLDPRYRLAVAKGAEQAVAIVREYFGLKAPGS